MLYFVLQQDIGLDTFPNWLVEHEVSRWVYVGEDSTWRVLTEFSIPETIQRISLAAELDRASWELRIPYLNWIGALSNRNNSPEWWASELASKNPYTQLFTRICLLEVSRSLAEKCLDETTAFICSTPALLRELMFYAEERKIQYEHISTQGKTAFLSDLCTSGMNYIKSVLTTLPPMVHLGNHFPPYQKLLETRNDYRRIVLREKNVLEIPKFKGNRGILLFTWVDRRNFTLQGEYRDPHFGPLPVELKKRGYEILFVPRVLYTIPYREAVDRLLNTRENFLFPEQCISTSDISSCQRRSNAFKPDIPEDITMGSVPVLSLAKEQIENYRTTLAENLVYEYLIKYLAECGILPSQIIHTCEGHSWEQVMTGAVRKYLPKTKAIGYDNVTFSRLVLSMYPAESELHIRPIPDRIVTNGPLFYEVLRKEGLPPDRIAKGCALRHTYLWDSSDPDSICRSKKTGPNRILVATSIGLGDSVELASKAALAFGGNSDYEILVKCHPMVDVNRVKTYLGSHTDFQNLAFVSESIDRLLPCADILLYTYTSICFEALRFGVFPICVRSENFLNLDPLDAAPSVRRVATTPEEIRKEVEGCIGMSAEERLNYENQAKGILKAALAPVTPSCIDSFILEEG